MEADFLLNLISDMHVHGWTSSNSGSWSIHG